jgi:predicted dinucleotide-binding enzyme
MELITATGFRAIDCGGFENARTLDVMVPLMIELDNRYQADASSSWKFLG